MKDDQILRGVGVVSVAVIMIVRLLVVGNGSVTVFGYEAAPVALGLLAIIILVSPETLNELPFGPTRSKK
jgi:hypothetical protein